MTVEEFLCASMPYRIKIMWLRPDDNTWQKSTFTLYDAPFLIGKKHKAIIRPFSDLTKECVQADYNNGEPFVPLLELASMVRKSEWELWRDCAVNERNDAFYFDSACNFLLYDSDCGHLDSINQLQLFQYLLKWHFWIDMPENEEAVYVSGEFNPYI